MADLSVQELFVQLHANIDEIHQTVQSLNDTKSHSDEMDRLELERERKIAEMKKQHEDAALELAELHEKEGKELEEKRRVEHDESMERRRREDEERAARIAKEEEERELVRKSKEEARIAEHEDKSLSLHKTIEEQLEQIEDEMERKVEEGKNKLAELDERRRAINAQIEAALNKPTVVPAITYRSRARTNSTKPTHLPATPTSATTSEIRSEANGSETAPDAETKSMDVPASHKDMTNQDTLDVSEMKFEEKSKAEMAPAENVKALKVDSTEDDEEAKQDHSERVPAAIKTGELDTKHMEISSPFPAEWESQSLDGPEDEVFVANAQRILQEHSRMRSLSSLGSSSGYGGGRESPATERKPVLELLDDGARDVLDQEMPGDVVEQSEDLPHLDHRIESEQGFDEDLESESEGASEDLQRSEDEEEDSGADDGQVTELDRNIDLEPSENASHKPATEDKEPEIVAQNLALEDSPKHTPEDVAEPSETRKAAPTSDEEHELLTKSPKLQETSDGQAKETQESDSESGSLSSSAIHEKDINNEDASLEDSPIAHADVEAKVETIDEDNVADFEPRNLVKTAAHEEAVKLEGSPSETSTKVDEELQSHDEPVTETEAEIQQQNHGRLSPAKEAEAPDTVTIPPEAPAHENLEKETVHEKSDSEPLSHDKSPVDKKVESHVEPSHDISAAADEEANIDDEPRTHEKDSQIEPRNLDEVPVIEDAEKMDYETDKSSADVDEKDSSLDQATAEHNGPEFEPQHFNGVSVNKAAESFEETSPKSPAIARQDMRSEDEPLADPSDVEFEPRDLDHVPAQSATGESEEQQEDILPVLQERAVTPGESAGDEALTEFEPRNLDEVFTNPEADGNYSPEISATTQERPSTSEESVADPSALDDEMEKSVSEHPVQNHDEVSDHEEEKAQNLTGHNPDAIEEHLHAQNDSRLHKDGEEDEDEEEEEEQDAAEVDAWHANEDHSPEANQKYAPQSINLAEHEQGDNSDSLTDEELLENFQPRDLDEALGQNEARQESQEVSPLEPAITAHTKGVDEDLSTTSSLSTNEQSGISDEVVKPGNIQQDEPSEVQYEHLDGSKSLLPDPNLEQDDEVEATSAEQSNHEHEPENGTHDLTPGMAAAYLEKPYGILIQPNLDLELPASSEEISFLDIAEPEVSKFENEEASAMPTEYDKHPVSEVGDSSTILASASEEATSDNPIAIPTINAHYDDSESGNEDLSASHAMDEDISPVKETPHHEESSVDSPIEADTPHQRVGNSLEIEDGPAEVKDFAHEKLSAVPDTPSHEAWLERSVEGTDSSEGINAENFKQEPDEIQVEVAQVDANPPLNTFDADKDTRSEADSEESSAVQAVSIDASGAEPPATPETHEKFLENRAAEPSEGVEAYTSAEPDVEQDMENFARETAPPAFSPIRETLSSRQSTPVDFQVDSPVTVVDAYAPFEDDSDIGEATDEEDTMTQPAVTVQEQEISTPKSESIASDNGSEREIKDIANANDWDESHHLTSVVEREPVESSSRIGHPKPPPNIFANLVNTIRPNIQLVRQLSDIPASPEEYYSDSHNPSREQITHGYVSDDEIANHQHPTGYSDHHDMNESMRYRSDTVGTAPGFDSYAPSDDGDTSPGTPIHEIVDNAQEALLNEHLISSSWPTRDTISPEDEDDHHLKAVASPGQEEFDPYNATQYGAYMTPKTSNMDVAANESPENVFRMSPASHDSSPAMASGSYTQEIQDSLPEQDSTPIPSPRSPSRSAEDKGAGHDLPASNPTSQDLLSSAQPSRLPRRPTLSASNTNSSSPPSIFQRTRNLFESSSNGTPLLPSLGMFNKIPRSPKGASPARIKTERPSSMYHVDPFPISTPPRRTMSSLSLDQGQQDDEEVEVLVPKSLDGSGKPPSPGFAMNQSRPAFFHKANSSGSNSEDGGFYTPSERQESFMGKTGIEESIHNPNNIGRSERATLLSKGGDDGEDRFMY